MIDYHLFAIHCDDNNTRKYWIVRSHFAIWLIYSRNRSQINLAINYAIYRLRETRLNSPAKSDVNQIHHGDQLRGSEPRSRFMVIRKLSSARQVVYLRSSSASFELEQLVTSRSFLSHIVSIGDSSHNFFESTRVFINHSRNHVWPLSRSFSHERGWRFCFARPKVVRSS